MSFLFDNACFWQKKLNFHFLNSLFSGIALAELQLNTERGQLPKLRIWLSCSWWPTLKHRSIWNAKRHGPTHPGGWSEFNPPSHGSSLPPPAVTCYVTGLHHRAPRGVNTGIKSPWKHEFPSSGQCFNVNFSQCWINVCSRPFWNLQLDSPKFLKTWWFWGVGVPASAPPVTEHNKVIEFVACETGDHVRKHMRTLFFNATPQKRRNDPAQNTEHCAQLMALHRSCLPPPAAPIKGTTTPHRCFLSSKKWFNFPFLLSSVCREFHLKTYHGKIPNDAWRQLIWIPGKHVTRSCCQNIPTINSAELNSCIKYRQYCCDLRVKCSGSGGSRWPEGCRVQCWCGKLDTMELKIGFVPQSLTNVGVVG